MKLLVCRECRDVVKLRMQMRSCECGAARGRYLEDGRHAEVFGAADVIGIANQDVHAAREAQEAGYPDAGACTLRAWMMWPGRCRVAFELTEENRTKEIENERDEAMRQRDAIAATDFPLWSRLLSAVHGGQSMGRAAVVDAVEAMSVEADALRGQVAAFREAQAAREPGSEAR